MTKNLFFVFILGLFFTFATHTAYADKPYCGDGKCSPQENYLGCPEDCPPPTECGDGNCDPDESQCDCPEDCGAPPGTESICNDGIDNDCNGYTDCQDIECLGTEECPCDYDGTCDNGEDCHSCPTDCNSGQGGSCEACFKGKCDGICNPKKEGPDCADCATYCCGLDTCDPDLCGENCGAVPYCGDGTVDPGEECDDGGESAVCNADCTSSICGDGKLNQTAGEECDDGGESAQCNADCTLSVCGDGKINATAGEQCDDGGESLECDDDCTPSVCGDEKLNLTAGEECDDGNTIPGDGCDELCQNEYTSSIPFNQYNIGDSIGEGEAADGTIGEAHHDKVWSTGYNTSDIVSSINERFEDIDPVWYSENNSAMDGRYNKAISGAVMADFVSQAQNVVAEATAYGGAGMVTILLGNNDVCADSLSQMTDPEFFETQFRAGLDILTASEATKNAEIHISAIPDIYWLWVAMKDDGWCRFVWWFGGVCQALLQNPGDDDCESIVSRDDPDTIYPGDGPNCVRRKNFHVLIRDEYNTRLHDVTEEYRLNGLLPNAYCIDIFDIRFTASEVNNGDCFHPSIEGHAFLAEEEWYRSKWGVYDPQCTP